MHQWAGLLYAHFLKCKLHFRCCKRKRKYNVVDFDQLCNFNAKKVAIRNVCIISIK